MSSAYLSIGPVLHFVSETLVGQVVVCKHMRCAQLHELSNERLNIGSDQSKQYEKATSILPNTPVSNKINGLQTSRGSNLETRKWYA